MKVNYLITYLVKWLNKYYKQYKMKTFIVGISGGIDSAVISLLCALTGKKTILVNLPILNFKKDIKNFNLHTMWIKKFRNIIVKNIKINEFANIKNLPSIKKISNKLVIANFYSRIRMVVLYILANKYKGLVVGTGNKIEDFGIGFFTKYGDGGIDISPIADLTKSQIYVIGKKIGIINQIMMTKPSDGLWNDNRCDKNQIGSSYTELEWSIDYLKKNNKNTFFKTKTKNDLNNYKNLRNKNFHKIKFTPICSMHKFFI